MLYEEVQWHEDSGTKGHASFYTVKGMISQSLSDSGSSSAGNLHFL